MPHQCRVYISYCDVIYRARGVKSGLDRMVWVLRSRRNEKNAASNGHRQGRRRVMFDAPGVFNFTRHTLCLEASHALAYEFEGIRGKHV